MSYEQLELPARWPRREITCFSLPPRVCEWKVYEPTLDGPLIHVNGDKRHSYQYVVVRIYDGHVNIYDSNERHLIDYIAGKRFINRRIKSWAKANNSVILRVRDRRPQK